ncbi:MAG: class I SAM-dependent methyltransferase [candidate division Zixibacteria bacterium]|nr:class I SAM-dependent methyltransferase [candidate division Zixibacteria bacterium]
MAWFYNRYWGNQFFERIYPLVEQEVLSRISPGCRILDLCCGTGQLAARLGSAGYDVLGVDISQEMLIYARQNAPNANFVVADARSFELSAPVFAALSLFDSLNHIMSIVELEKVFERVHTSLKPGGIFMFDLNVEDGFLQRWKGSFSIVEADHLFVARSSYDRAEKIGRLDLTMFRLREDVWHRRDEVFFQRAYRPEEISQAVVAVGFTIVKAGLAEEFGLSSQGRLVVVARKPAIAELS